MPTSTRAHGSRVTPSRPYDRPSPTTTIAQSENSYPPCSLPAAQPIQPSDADVPPDHPGLPTYAEYKRIEAGYLHSLSPRKRDKALITQAMFDKIWDVLHQPEACTIETPQFRFWVRKMFTLSRSVRGVVGTGPAGTYALHDAYSDAEEGEEALELERSMVRRFGAADEHSFSAVVLHENRPVAILEQLYEVFCYCHVRAGHGGRDKTCAVIREHYSWVPKELTAQFVKACPTCALKRSGQAHAAMGGVVGVGVLAHRQVAERRRRRTMPSEMGAQETSEPGEQFGLGWPTTRGPLDPEPCGVHEREWLRACGGVSPANPVSPAYGSGAWPVREALPESCSPGRWGTVLRTLTLDSSPFLGSDMARSPGHPFATSNSNARRNDQEARSPTKTGLTSLTAAPSNESLDEDVNLTSLGPGGAAECPLPPVLRPLRLLGPASSDAESYPIQIDPVLLSFSYPGLGLCSESSFASDCVRNASDATARPLQVGLIAAGSTAIPGARGTNPNLASPGRLLYRLDGPSSIHTHMAMLNQPQSPSREWHSPDASFEHCVVPHVTTAGGAAVDTSPSTELTAQRQCGSRHGHQSGSFGMLYHSGGSADEVGQQLERDRLLSLSTVTNA